MNLNREFAYLLISICFVACLSCQRSHSTSDKSQNNSKDLYEPSELANTMREMAYDMEALRLRVYSGELSAGEVDDLISSHSKMGTDNPTDIDEIKPSFELFSKIYIEQLEELKIIVLNQDKISEQIILFNAALSTCVSCHREHCPGPISRIEKIKI